MNRQILMIETEKIFEHPDNPRKNLGDLSEMSESIRKNGVMQNLTVIPGHYEDGEWKDDLYTVLIGHRRLNGARLAGVEKVPCSIMCDTDKRQQVAIMLEENMQRNDLTIYEQAQGFQMMLDLGETPESIADKTGFSKTTVYHRLNIAKLDKDELKKKEEDSDFQLSFNDLYALEKVKSVDKRNEILKEARDSSNLVFLARQAAEEEEHEKVRNALVKLCEKAGIKKAPKGAEKERYSGKWCVLDEWNVFYSDKIPESIGEYSDDVCYVVYGYSVAVIKPVSKKRELSPYEIKERERKSAQKELKNISKQMFDTMSAFMKSIIETGIKPSVGEAELYLECIKTMINARLRFGSLNFTQMYYGKEESEYSCQMKDGTEFAKYLEWKHGLNDLQRAIVSMLSVQTAETWSYNNEFKPEAADRINAVVKFLELYGFSLNEESRKLLDGTHELYAVKDND